MIPTHATAEPTNPAKTANTANPANPPSPRRPPHAPPQGVAPGDPSRLWRALGLPAARAAAPRPLFHPDGDLAFRDLAGLFVGPHEAVLAIAVDPQPPRPRRRQAVAGGRQASGIESRENTTREESRSERRLALLLEAIALVVEEHAGARAGAPETTADPQPLVDFLDGIDRAIDPSLEIHLILDRRSSCRTPLLRQWFRLRPRFHAHFTAGPARWRERALAWLTYAADHQEAWSSGPRSALALAATLRRYVLRPPAGPRAFAWARSADEHLTCLARHMLRRSRRGRQG